VGDFAKTLAAYYYLVQQHESVAWTQGRGEKSTLEGLLSDRYRPIVAVGILKAMLARKDSSHKDEMEIPDLLFGMRQSRTRSQITEYLTDSGLAEEAVIAFRSLWWGQNEFSFNLTRLRLGKIFSYVDPGRAYSDLANKREYESALKTIALGQPEHAGEDMTQKLIALGFARKSVMGKRTDIELLPDVLKYSNAVRELVADNLTRGDSIVDSLLKLHFDPECVSEVRDFEGMAYRPAGPKPAPRFFGVDWTNVTQENYRAIIRQMYGADAVVQDEVVAVTTVTGRHPKRLAARDILALAVAEGCPLDETSLRQFATQIYTNWRLARGEKPMTVKNTAYQFVHNLHGASPEELREHAGTGDAGRVRAYLKLPEIPAGAETPEELALVGQPPPPENLEEVVREPASAAPIPLAPAKAIRAGRTSYGDLAALILREKVAGEDMRKFAIRIYTNLLLAAGVPASDAGKKARVRASNFLYTPDGLKGRTLEQFAQGGDAARVSRYLNPPEKPPAGAPQPPTDLGLPAQRPVTELQPPAPPEVPAPQRAYDRLRQGAELLGGDGSPAEAVAAAQRGVSSAVKALLEKYRRRAAEIDAYLGAAEK
jgi:hypothetical protein